VVRYLRDNLPTLHCGWDTVKRHLWDSPSLSDFHSSP
jgi:hypothetical protein